MASRLLGIALATTLGGATLLALGVGFLLGTEAGTTWLLQQSSTWTQGALTLGGHRGTLAGGLSVRSVRWEQDRLQVNVDTAELDISWLDLLDGALTVDQLLVSGVVVQWQSGPPSPNTLPSLPQPPLPVSIHRLEVKDARWQSADARPIHFATINLEARWDPDGLLVDSLEVVSSFGSLTGVLEVGGPSPHGLSGQIQVHALLPELPVLEAAVAVSGNMADPELLAEILAPYQATLNVNVSHQGPYSLAGPVSIALHELNADWPKIRMAGEVEGAGRGTELDYAIKLLVNVDEQPLIAIPLAITGRISPAGTVIEALLSERGNERITGAGVVTWGEQLNASLDLAIENLKPASWWRDWSTDLPAQVNGIVRASLTSSGQGSDLHFDLTQLDLKGDLRNLPFQLSAAGEMTGKVWKLNVFTARYGKSHGSATVTRDQVFDARASLVVPGVGEWLADANGNATAEISLRGDPADPEIKLTVSGKELALGGIASADLDLAIDGRLSRHQVSLQFSDPRSRLDAEWTGRLKLDELQVDDYRGDLTRLNLQVPGFTELQLWAGPPVDEESRNQDNRNRPVSRFHWQPDQYVLEQTCLDAADSRLCVAGEWRAEGGQGTLALSNFPLQSFAGQLPGDYQIEGSADLVGSWRFDPGAAVHWQPDLRLSTSAIRISANRVEAEPVQSADAGGGVDQSRFDPFRLAPIVLTLKGGARGPWQLVLRQPDVPDSGLSGEATMAFAETDWRTSTIAGELRAMSTDIAFLEVVLPYAIDIKGKASGAVTLGGTLGQPGFEGVVEWTEGGFRLPAQGLTWTDVSIRVGFPALADSGFRRIDVVGRGISGGGTLVLEGGVDWTGDIKTSVGEGRLTGSRVRVLNTDLAQVHASPDLQLRLDNGLVSLDGEVLLPKAMVRFRERPVSAVNVSADQRLRGMSAPTAQTPAYNVKADVNLRFGDDVKFTGFGLDATLGGGITLKQRGRQTTANGSIVTRSGTYTAYGQELAVNRGRLLWSDTPLLKPAIDVDASRTPSKEITVGLRASGPIERPEVSLYSVPGMPQSEQLSWLLFGRSLQTTSSNETSVMNDAALALGVRAGDFLTKRFGGGLGLDQVGIEVPAGEGNETAALVLGKFLTPDLYVSYGISLLQALSTLRIEYALSQNWRVVTESSAERNSADLFFVKERQ